MAIIRGNLVVGVFDDAERARAAIDQLLTQGLGQHDLVLLAKHGGQIDTVPADVEPHVTHQPSALKTAEVGAAAGAGLGLLGALAIVTTGALPVVGPVVAGGLLTMLAGGAAGSVAGGLIGGLVGLGLEDHEAHYYQHALSVGRVIVTARTATRQQEVAELMNRLGAENIAPAAQVGPAKMSHLHLGQGIGSGVAAGGFTASGGFAEQTQHEHFHLPGATASQPENVESSGPEGS